MIEQRRARRFPIRVQLHITGEPDLEISADTQDISASGLLLSTDQQVADGSMLRFVMTFPASVTKGKPLRVRCTGQVVRVDKKPSDYEVAVRFKHFQFLSPTFDR